MTYHQLSTDQCASRVTEIIQCYEKSARSYMYQAFKHFALGDDNQGELFAYRAKKRFNHCSTLKDFTERYKYRQAILYHIFHG